MRVCLFGTYNRGHSANRIYAAAIRAAGAELIEIHEPLWERTRDKDARYFSAPGLLELAGQWLVAAWRLMRRWRASGGAPVVVIGFNGQLDILLLRLLTLRRRPRIVFAPLVTLTETLIDDRRVYRRDSLAASLLAALDRFGCRLADVVVADTSAHRDYLVGRIGVDSARVAVCLLGVDNAVFAQTLANASPAREPQKADRPEKLEVLYFGQYLPLHGLDVVVDAVGRLATRADLRFVFIGTGEERARIEPLLGATRADVELVSWVPYEELGARIARADIVLGVFGASPKARMVVPNKVYEAAVVGRPVITADTPAMREAFVHEQTAWLCEPSGQALARAIERLASDRELRARLGRSARQMMLERFSDAALGRSWAPLLGGEDTPPLPADAGPEVGIVVLNFNDAAATLRCLGSLTQSRYRSMRILVVDNGSRAEERRKLEQSMAGRFPARIEWLDENQGFARANNRAMERLFAGGCEHVLLLNDDTVVTPDAVGMLVRCARRHPEAGPIGPRIARDRPGAPAASLGERCWPALAWLPRSLVRYRATRYRCYPVHAIQGCAMLLSRAAYERVGGFEEDYFAYYEEVDLCLRARAAGMMARVEPAAEIAHGGHRGFGGGFSVPSAYLKARNLWLFGRRRLGGPALAVFAAGYFALLAVSMAGYALRGRVQVASALGQGMAAGWRGETGRPPAWVFDSAAPLVATGTTTA